jgi:D-alanyl-D-alanine carboxypeptidase
MFNKTMFAARVCALLAVMASGAAVQMCAQELDAATKQKADEVVAHIMQQTGVPGVQLGVVRGDKVVYEVARGEARTTENGKAAIPATLQMSSPIGSISKQFTVACILLLQERGKLNLDDPVSTWFPELTRSNEITIRMLLTHTSGYRDFAPQDYTIPEWLQPAHPIDIVHHWAELPLDFDPMTKMQYSNTNYVLVGLIVEKVTGETFPQFLRESVLQPLKLPDVLDLDTDRAEVEPTGYRRNALGPPRPALAEAPGWYTAAGTLVMPVSTLMQWDLSLLNKALLKPESYAVMEKEQRLKDGGPTNSGLGLLRGGLQARVYHAKYATHEISISTYWTPDGKLEQFLVEPE